MTDTLFSILHTFLHQNHATNQLDHHHRITLARIICVWRDLLVDGDYFEHEDEGRQAPAADLPDLCTMSGIINLLSLYNFVQLGSLLWTERYRGEKLDRQLGQAYATACAAGDEILGWLKDRITITIVKAHGPSSPEDVRPEGYPDINPKHQLLAMRDSYLTQQIAALSNAMKDLPPNSCDSWITQESLVQFATTQYSKTLPTVHQRLAKFFEVSDLNHEALVLPDDSYPLAPQDISTYAWEYQLLGDDFQYAIATENSLFLGNTHDPLVLSRLSFKSLKTGGDTGWAKLDQLAAELNTVDVRDTGDGEEGPGENDNIQSPENNSPTPHPKATKNSRTVRKKKAKSARRK
ncbi:hypothetical protein AAF712_008557 [Marasmius tenuissimus]|uniref:Uncharacterized protein n=1 Tax=Marasmius tenuissimus TaxID=585030 RepID=A0ABR2ZTU7_9AGAR